MNTIQGMAPIRRKRNVHEGKKQIDSPLAPQGNDSPSIPILIRLLLDLGGKTDRAHDPVPKLLVQYRLVRISIRLDHFIQPVNQWLLGRHLHHVAPEGKPCQLFLQLTLFDSQDRGQLFDILGDGLRLTVEDGGDGDFIAAELLGNVGKGELLGSFSGEEGVGLNRETVSKAGLRLMLAIDW